MAVMAVSTHAVYLQKGKLIASDTPESIIGMYEEDLFSNNAKVIQGELIIPKKEPTESSGIDITHLCFKDFQKNTLNFIQSGEPANFCTGFMAHQSFENVSLRVEVREVSGEDGTVLFLSGWLDRVLFDVQPGHQEILLQFPYVGFKPGVYSVSVNLRRESNYIFDTIESFTFVVKGDANMSKCKFYQPHSWDLVIHS